MTIILSREVLALIGRHCWGCKRDHIGYGYLAGIGNTVSCALPLTDFDSVSEVRAVADELLILDSAGRILRPFGLRLVGRYATWSDYYHELKPDHFQDIEESSTGIFIAYEPICCRSHSSIRIFRRTSTAKWQDSKSALSSGVRLSNAVNQRRVGQAWNRALKRRDYKDRGMALN